MIFQIGKKIDYKRADMRFLEMEGGYIAIAIFFLVITIIVTTRSFMPKKALKNGLLIVGSILIIFIGFHYYITIERMKSIALLFHQGKTILCENKENLMGAQVIIINKKADWTLKDGVFSNPNFYRSFHSARCAPDYK